MKSLVQRPINVTLLLAAMMVLCMVMLWPTLHMGLWLDELCSLNDVMYPDVQTVIAKMWGRMDDLHPPLYFVPLFACVKLFGVNDLAVRTAPLIFGLLLIPATYWLGKTVHSRFVGLLAAFFATISPFANYYDCQSRGYGMAAFLTALSLISFCKLADTQPGKKVVPFIGVALTTAALCYTEYISCFILPALGVAAIWIYFAMRRDPEKAAQALPTFIRCGAALTLGFLLYLPWLPSMKMQSGNMTDLVDLAPRYYWPLIFSYNLMMMYPIPMIISIPLSVVGLLALVYYLIRNRKKYQGFKATVFSVPPALIVVLCAVAIPSSLVGFVTPWFYGYFRYIYPYTAGGWCLIAILFYHLFGFAHADRVKSDTADGGSKKGAVWFTVVLVAMLALNGLYDAWFVSRPQSGLRTVAQDAMAGKYDNSLILVAPDVIAITLGYYLTPKERAAHHITVAGYPRWDDPFPPIPISDLARLWGPEIPQEAEKRIEALPKQGFKFLVIAKDSDKQIELLTTPTVQRTARVKALMEIVNRKYKKLSETHYNGLTEDVTVSTYELPHE
ncbi:MAG: glycosyltransferase family 39 protein [Candidatus Melainabacteria bacterium]|nr:glycosyltransferase family 39 protein [Candidatus Melainabacteria bacterium]